MIQFHHEILYIDCSLSVVTKVSPLFVNRILCQIFGQNLEILAIVLWCSLELRACLLCWHSWLFGRKAADFIVSKSCSSKLPESNTYFLRVQVCSEIAALVFLIKCSQFVILIQYIYIFWQAQYRPAGYNVLCNIHGGSWGQKQTILTPLGLVPSHNLISKIEWNPSACQIGLPYKRSLVSNLFGLQCQKQMKSL